MTLSRTIEAIVRRGESEYVAECVPSVEFRLASSPSLLVTMELEPISA